jgi:hypothetical protein
VADDEFTKPPGRPRLYASASEKLSAFRARLEQAGYVRREVLVTRSTEERVKALAEEQNVKPLDVYSAMVAYGLDAYKREHGAAEVTLSGSSTAQHAQASGPFMQGGEAGRAGLAQETDRPLAAAPAPGTVTHVTAPGMTGSGPASPERSNNPIAAFFQKRKETLK